MDMDRSAFPSPEELDAACEELRLREEALLEAQRIAHLGSWVVDLREQRLNWSDEVFRLLGIEPCEPSLELMASLLHPDDRELFFSTIDRAVADGTHFDIAVRVVRPDGEVRHLHDRGRVCFDAAGAPSRVCGVLQDVTERELLRAAVQRQNQMESIGLLAGGIGHDFNNLLTGILGSASLAQLHLAEGETEQVAELLTGIETIAQRAAELTSRLLTVARGGGEPKPRALNCGELVREAATLALRGSGVRPEFACADDLLPIFADPGQIHQVIANLVINARQATAGGGVVSLTCENVELSAAAAPNGIAAGRYVSVTVRDCGCGIPADQLQRIFEPFFSTKEQGRGLGLASCMQIMQRHGGHISVASEVGRGSTFTVLLPAALERPAETVVATPGAVLRRQRRGLVLVLDDQEQVRTTVVGMLRRLGYEALSTADQAETLTIYGEALSAGTPPVAVLLDLILPGGAGGEEVAREIRELDPAAFLVACSGRPDLHAMLHPEEHGFQVALAKPFDLRAITTVLQRATRH